MSLIDFILNSAAVLLWLNWRAVRGDPLVRAAPATLVGTLRRAEPSRLRRWHVLFILAALIPLRAVIYAQLGPAVDWSPKLNLGVVRLAFRADLFWQELLFNSLSFLRILVIFHFWLLTLALINWRTTEPDPILKTLRVYLDRVARWPRWVQALLPVVCVAILWAAVHPWLARAGVISPAQSRLHLAGQALLLGGVLYSSLQYLLPAVLVLHLLANYVYLGKGAVWEFIGNTSRNLLRPLSRLPLRYQKLDFAPLVGIALVFWCLGGQRYTLPWLIQRLLSQYHLTLWPL